MKKLVLILAILLTTTLAHAGVDFEVLDFELDGKNFVVRTNYILDGVEVPSNYPKLNGKYYFITRYNALNFEGMTANQILLYIRDDLILFAEGLIIKEYQREKLLQAEANNTFANVIGYTYTVNNASRSYDTNGDNIADETWTFNTDGTKSVTPIP